MENAATLPRSLKTCNTDQLAFELTVEGTTCASCVSSIEKA
jgi:hypothetical protein